jgi:hypothetical protein
MRLVGAGAAALACGALSWACSKFGTANDAVTDGGNDAGATTSSGIAWVQSKAAQSATPGALAFDRPVTAHSTIVVAVLIDPPSAPLASVTDGLGNRYSTVVGDPASPDGFRLQIAAAFDVSGGPDTVTVTSSGAQLLDIYIHEYAGLSSDGVDKTSSTDGDSNTGPTARASVTTSAPNELLFAFGIAGGTSMTAGGLHLRRSRRRAQRASERRARRCRDQSQPERPTIDSAVNLGLSRTKGRARRTSRSAFRSGSSWSPTSASASSRLGSPRS